MPFRNVSYDPKTVALMSAALDAAWNEAQQRQLTKTTADHARSKMASAILAAVAEGERDPIRLKNYALRSVDTTGLH
jgi:hypothetical protein